MSEVFPESPLGSPPATDGPDAAAPSLRGRVTSIAATLRREADGIDNDPLLNQHIRHADAEAKRRAAAHLDDAINEDTATRARPLSEGFEQALATIRRLAGAAAPSRAARVRVSVAEAERLIRAAMADEPPPATATPGRPLTAPDVVASLLADVADSRAQLADAAPELAAAMAETRTVREGRWGFQALCEEFGDSPQSGMSARVSHTTLSRYRQAAGLDPLTRTQARDREDITMRYRRERDEAREQLAEVRRIAYQGGQSATSVRSQLLAYLEVNGGING